MFSSNVSTIQSNVNMNATPIGWCGLHPFITGGVIGALAGGVGCLAGCMLRDKRNQATWEELGSGVWDHYKVIKKENGEELKDKEFDNFKNHPDIYGSWWNYLRGNKIYNITKKDQENIRINFEKEEKEENVRTDVDKKKIIKINESNNNEIIDESINDKNQDNQRAFTNLEVENNIDAFFIAGKTGKALMELFIEKIPEEGIEIGDKMDLKKIYNMIIKNQGRLKEFLDFLIRHYEVNKDADILSFITNILTSLGDEELIKFLMGNDDLKAVVLKIMEKSEDEGVVALREKIKAMAQKEVEKIIETREVIIPIENQAIDKQIETLSYLLTLPGVMDEANKNEEINDWFIKLLNYYQGKETIPTESIPLIIGLFSKMKNQDIAENIDKLQDFFNKIVEVYDGLGNDGKKEIVNFAINILNKISRPIEQNNNGKNEVDNTYKLLLNFIIDKLKEDEWLLNDVFNDDDFFNLVLNNEHICLKILPFIIKKYDPEDIIKSLTQKPQQNPEEGKQNEENNQDPVKRFLIAFLKQFGADISVDEWKEIFEAYENINDFLKKLLKASIESNKILTKDLWNIIFEVIDEEDKKEQNNISQDSGNKKTEAKKTSIDLIPLIAKHINKMNNEELNVLVNEVDAGQLIKLLLAILDDIDKDKNKNENEEKKYDEGVYERIFKKIVNEKNIEAFIEIILNDGNLKNKILSNTVLKKLFLQQIIQKPDVIIKNYFDVDNHEEEEKEENEKNNLNKKNNKPNQDVKNNKKSKEFWDFFLNLWGQADKELLKSAYVKEFLTAILTHVKEKIPEQKRLDILWQILKAPILNDNDKKNMPESFWLLLRDIVLQMDKHSQTVPPHARSAIELWKKRNKMVPNNVEKKGIKKGLNDKKNNRKSKNSSLLKETCSQDRQYGGTHGKGKSNQISTNSPFNIRQEPYTVNLVNNNKLMHMKSSKDYYNNNFVYQSQLQSKYDGKFKNITNPETKDYHYKNKTEYGEKYSEQAYENVKNGVYAGNVKTINSGNKNNKLSSTMWKVDTKIAEKRSLSRPPIKREKESIIKNTNIEQKINNTNSITFFKPKIDRQNIDKNKINNGKNNNVGATNKQSSKNYEMKMKDMNNLRKKCYNWGKEDYNKNIINGRGSGKLFG